MRTVTAAALILLAACSPADDADSGATGSGGANATPDMVGEWAILAPFPIYDDLSSYSLPDASTPAWPLVTLEVDASTITVGIDYAMSDGSRGWAIVEEGPNDCTTSGEDVECTVLGERVTFSPRHDGWSGDAVTITTSSGDTTVVSL